ncbi:MULTISPECIES: PP2C family protein-serine/threonine phosphatase [unclassified Streptomyces]|uniref:PP2C family protein-serine/threonine phosphatase n=1 Tax=unclassified Streptomyces TaxID=2593676 RepID=UPI002251F586|nr:PP2C family protein-serine/threonine phosphatase [Streptomyces sp. NBC_00338]MCX5144701.1 serine/threonine-protein phosphatase [Streptomyces sp. NBC_00338]WSU56999.1 serine/threonine-protein phosphatase [Streptomyces sp. NBC_01104]
MTIGLQHQPKTREPVLPGLDPGEAAVLAPRVGNRALFGGLALLIAVIVLLDMGSGDELRIVPLLVVVPALVSVFGTVRQTVGVASWIMVVAVISRLMSGGTFWDITSSVLFTVLACFLGVGACKLRIRHATEIARLRSAAVALQRQILRPLPILTDQVAAHGTYAPIEEDRLVGGDIYEVVQSPYGTRVIIGDVQGKGLAAIGAGFAVLGAFREAAIREPTLTGVVDALEDAVARHNAFSAQTGEIERFVTALVLGLDGAGRVQAVNCGHLPPRLLHDGVAGPVPLRRTSVPLGMAELSSEARVTERLDFPPGATLLMFTDGVTEARDAAGTFYPLDTRLDRWAGLGPRELLDALHADLEEFSGGVRRDDIAVLALRRTPSGVHRSALPGRGAQRAAEVFSGR